MLATLMIAMPAASASTDPCAPPVNVIACENSKPGTPSSVWDIDGVGDPTVQGFATSISVDVGDQIGFKVRTEASAYTIKVYRLGWYGGDGAREWATLNPTLPLAPNDDADCVHATDSQIFDCGTWQVGATWDVPVDAVSGVYIARVIRSDTGGDSHIPFIVRDDTSTSELVFQTSDTTWQAYNRYGGADFYWGAGGGPLPRAYKLSYNRPFATRGAQQGRDFLFSNEYPMIRFLERNGYDVSYISGLDADIRGELLLNHEVYVSVGHDEYWSPQQRANVEAARDAGVHLAFFTGNEVYWKVRWEDSVDGNGTAYRTLVCYKETWDNARIDPSDEWTGVWRDPRFPTGETREPENALVGNLYMANNTDLAMQVPAEQGKLRFWRHTGVADLAPGQTATLAPHTVGYESNEDLDNGFRPAGTFRLSTTTGFTPEYLVGYGPDNKPGDTTHHMTMYRAASGALVFGAGTIQWSWGLDAYHDGGSGAPADEAIQQATVNLFADMGAEPTTPMPGIMVTSGSTDVLAPTVTITGPADGASVAHGAPITVTGTASDAGGGLVAGVEVSTNGGETWHPATTGTHSWTYEFLPTDTSAQVVLARAVDDSGNLGAPSEPVTLSVSGPYSLFGQAVPDTPAFVETVDGSPNGTPLSTQPAVEVGVRFTPQIDGLITGLRFYKGEGNTGEHRGTLWSNGGSVLATAVFTEETDTGWQQVSLPAPVPVSAGTSYVVSYFAPNGRYASDAGFFLTDHVSGPLVAPGTEGTVGNGVYREDEPGFPNGSWGSTNYYADVTFVTAANAPPTVSSTAPIADAANVPAEVTPSVVFSKPVDESTIAFTLVDADDDPVPGAVSYDEEARRATFTPVVPLAEQTTYTATVSARDDADVPMNAPYSWSFTSTFAADVVTLFETGATPQTTASGENLPVEVGLKFTPSVDGQVVGMRFYRGPGNTGSQVGRLWPVGGGAPLAEVTFPTGGGTGWQAAAFAEPVTVSAGTTYVLSYYAPNGNYAYDSGFFVSGYSRGPLSAPSGENGIYRYGAGGGFPTETYGSANYWIDPYFLPTGGSTSPTPSPSPTSGGGGAEGTAPAVSATVPTSDATAVAAQAVVSALLDADIDVPSLEFELRDAANALVAGTVAYDEATRLATFTPSAALQSLHTYTASVSASSAGTAMAQPHTWSFTTTYGDDVVSLFPPDAVPQQSSVGESAAVELGVKFTPSVDGQVVGMRFYRGPGNTGSQVGRLWPVGGGAPLAEVTFPTGGGTGWQAAAFAEPVTVSAGTTYVLSYYAPNGNYAYDSGFFVSGYSRGPLSAPSGENGIYRYGAGGGFPTGTYNSANYWVDPLYVPDTGADTGPDPSPTTSPSPDGPGSSPSPTVSPTGSPTPSPTADPSPTGTPSPSPEPTVGPTAPPAPAVHIFGPDDVPTAVNWTDDDAVEVGVRFRSDVAGQITGVRFYKGPANTGTHRGSLWSAEGVRLATAVFVDETESGWQTVTFDQPVPILANTTYVASYHTSVGQYAVTANQFQTAELDRSPLHVLVGGGAYHYDPYGWVFPGHSVNHNYWVDVVFTPNS
ncbi:MULTISPECIES: DUF4082 domain-containing protein [unclassified Solwaraspora]|uniref:DUF4082 domain-containing protein n=1 Tax=unclassified Solwaraspora TaxID=2627926 RepID=UPI00259AF72B|nr:DUF4082 domain-containing protein [Solwaraspora sp. WMMA2056]WJK42954.1 DUF4082 domain-containing protein [Solwaraspora sp. WMMA2056]